MSTPTSTAAKDCMNAGLIEAAVRRHVDPRSQLLIPEAAVRYRCGIYTDWRGAQRQQFGDYRADFMMISTSGYATEVEVKISRADWRADLAKPKWQGMPDWITRFIYAAPASLGIPDFVPEHAGVWHIEPCARPADANGKSDGYRNVVARAPRRLGKEKVPQAVVDRWMKNFYYRYWDMRRHAERRIPSRQPEQRIL